MKNEKIPLVMCLTNSVAQDITANVLLAIGAKPAMVEEPSEAAELAGVADAVLVNLGTVHPRQTEAMLAAVSEAPYVLDPVAAHLLKYRRKVMEALFAERLPTVIRGNAAEIDFLRKNYPDLSTKVPMLATGAVDRIYWGTDLAEVRGGVEMLSKVTATGCSQGAVVAAFLGWGQTPVEALFSASRLMKRAGERAWERAKTPGSFRTQLIDALYDEGGAGND